MSKVATQKIEQIPTATLNLGSTQITDAGLEHLKGLTSLTTLYLANTKITDAGLAERLAEIKAALPNCVIYRW